MLSACATTGDDSPNTVPQWTTSPAVEIARAAARIGLSVTLQSYGVPPDVTATILAELRTIVDGLLAGEGLSVVTDPARWDPLRARVKAQVVELFTRATVNGVPLIDPATAGVITDQLIDSFAAAVRRLIK
ncbi:MAG TPA: hypothetical protein VF787_26605 [Thermoanaerobaculia bacterium]